MSQHDLPADQCYETVGTLDIETSGFDGATEDLIAIGTGYYEAGSEEAEVEVHTFHDHDGGQGSIIKAAYEWLNDRDPDALATFHGKGFDFEFLDAKQETIGFHDYPDLACRQNHIDLIVPRKRKTPRNKKWPSLEECLDAYEIPEYETTWNGEKLTNTRFGEELAPRYVEAFHNVETGLLADLEAVVREYTETDIESNIALYEHDAGREYTPTYAR